MRSFDGQVTWAMWRCRRHPQHLVSTVTGQRAGGPAEELRARVHDDVAGEDHRHGQQQASPEPALEHRHVVTSVLAVAAAAPAVVLVPRRLVTFVDGDWGK